MINKSVAIIGAGLSASVCAKSLNGLVKNITLFERSSYIGGRLHLSNELATTHSFTISTPFFQQVVDRWMLDSLVSEITPWNVEISDEETNSLVNTQSEYSIKPRMTVLVESLLEGVNIRLNTEVADIEKSGDRWRLFDFEGGYLGQFDSVIFTSSAPSVYDIIKPSELLMSQIKKIQHASVWSVVLLLNEKENIAFDYATFIDSSLSSCFRNEDNTVVLQSTPEWSEKYAALSMDQVADQLSEEFCRLTHVNVDSILVTSVKFWSNKSPINTVGEDCLFDDTTGLGACGDWCTSPRVEGAVISGFSIADRVMKYFS